MKTTKKILALLMVTVMALAMLAGCGSKDKKEVEKVVEEYCEAFKDFDMEAMLDCLDEDSDRYENIKDAVDNGGIPSEITEEMPEKVAKRFAEVSKNLFKKLYAKAEYKVEKVEIDGDEATVTIVGKGDFTNDFGTGTDGDSNEFGEKAKEMLNERMQENAAEIQYMSEDEQIDWALDEMEEIFDELSDEMIEELEDADEKEYKFELEKIDDEWKIVD